jgi:hypothetical protein
MRKGWLDKDCSSSSNVGDEIPIAFHLAVLVLLLCGDNVMWRCEGLTTDMICNAHTCRNEMCSCSPETTHDSRFQEDHDITIPLRSSTVKYLTKSQLNSTGNVAAGNQN